MHDPKKLPVEIWAERDSERTRVMLSVDGYAAFELISYPRSAVVENGKLVIPVLVPIELCRSRS